MSAREDILGRVRAAAGTGSAAQAYAGLSRGYQMRAALGSEERVALMIERLREYDAEVLECAPARLSETIAEHLAASARKAFVAPPGLPREWMVAGNDWRVDGGLSNEEIERTDAVVTVAFCGVAESGTIVLHHSASEGRRVLTLLPDWHLCVLRASQIVEVLPEYFARCVEPPRLATLIAGPSATADIEMTRVKGVHGPRFLHVVVVRDDQKRDDH
jgi:L-lactate dehydrogenase complex protein LldG